MSAHYINVIRRKYSFALILSTRVFVLWRANWDPSCKTVTNEQRFNLFSHLNYSLHFTSAILRAFFMLFFYQKISFPNFCFRTRNYFFKPNSLSKACFFDSLFVISNLLIHIMTHLYFTFRLKWMKYDVFAQRTNILSSKVARIFN